MRKTRAQAIKEMIKNPTKQRESKNDISIFNPTARFLVMIFEAREPKGHQIRSVERFGVVHFVCSDATSLAPP